MANVLTADDSTFDTSVGNWTGTSISRDTTPTPHAGTGVLHVADPTDNPTIPAGIYPISPGEGTLLRLWAQLDPAAAGFWQLVAYLTYYDADGVALPVYWGEFNYTFVGSDYLTGSSWTEVVLDNTPSVYPDPFGKHYARAPYRAVSFGIAVSLAGGGGDAVAFNVSDVSVEIVASDRPANDPVADPIELPYPDPDVWDDLYSSSVESDVYTNLWSTLEGGEPATPENTGTVWFAWTAPPGALHAWFYSYNIGIGGVENYVEVFTEGFEAVPDAEVISDPHFGTRGVTFPVVLGTRYLIRISSPYGDTYLFESGELYHEPTEWQYTFFRVIEFGAGLALPLRQSQRDDGLVGGAPRLPGPGGPTSTQRSPRLPGPNAYR